MIESTNDALSPAPQTWNSYAAIAAALASNLCSPTVTFLPDSGYHTFLGVRPSRERGCLELAVSDGLVHVVRPRRLALESFSEKPTESFLLLELDALAPSGVYDPTDVQPDAFSEPVLEIPSEGYKDYSLYGQGFLGYDEDGREIPLPQNNRVVVRWHRGQMLFVQTSSLINSERRSDDGRYGAMTAADIRAVIEQKLAGIRHGR